MACYGDSFTFFFYGTFNNPLKCSDYMAYLFLYHGSASYSETIQNVSCNENKETKQTLRPLVRE
jgi:hypothetical protein